jgi:Rad3-related DNA helicase
VPDIVAWNNLRKHVWPQLNKEGTLKLTALAEPQGYLCRRRLTEILKAPQNRLPLEERALALPLAAWADQSPSSFIADCRGFSPDRTRLLWSRVCCDAYDEDPGAQAARSEAESADIVLITFTTLFSHLKLEGALLPRCDSIIMAGAHRLPEMGRRGFGQEVTFFRLNPVLRLLRHSRERDTGLWPDLESYLGNSPETGFTAEEWASHKENWFEPEKQFQKFFQKAGKQAAKRRAPGENRIRYTEPVALAFGVNPEPVLSALKDQETFLQRCQEGLTTVLAQRSPQEKNRTDLISEIRRVHSRLRAFRLDFERLCDARDAKKVYWLEDFSNPHKAALRSAPRDLHADFGSRLQTSFDGGLLISPAMTLASDEGSFFLGFLGLSTEVDPSQGANKDDTEEVPVEMHRTPVIASPPFLLAPFVPAAASMESAGAFARFLLEATQPFSEKGIFVLFTSPGPLRAVYQALRALLPAGEPLFAQHVDGGKDTLIKLFASSHGGWVLATEGMEGFHDAEDHAPALVVVTRMPLPSMREPWWEAQADRLRSQGRNLRYDLWHPAAALRLKRELAPLRHAEGLKMVWLLDARASGEGLGAYAARSLGCESQIAMDLPALQSATRAVLF